MHVSTAQATHEFSRSKTVIQTLNRIGLCMNYDELERQDHPLICSTIARGDGYRVPLPPVISLPEIIQGAMGNFDHEEDTKSGIGRSHDTVRVIFRKTPEQPIQADTDSFMDTVHLILIYRKKHLNIPSMSATFEKWQTHQARGYSTWFCFRS